MGIDKAAMDALDELKALRGRMLPMLRAIAREYETRTEAGYPVVIDNVERTGYFGIQLDPGYGLYIITDGRALVAQLNIVGWRSDVRSSANKEKFSNAPFAGERPISQAMSDAQLRNLLAELLAAWNTQPLLMNVTDS